MKTKCVGIVGILFGHKYHARYSKGEPTITSVQQCSASQAINLIESSKKRTYECDVCVRCGDIKR